MRVDWKGIIPALSTPCKKDNSLDEESLRSEVRWNIEVGAHGLVVTIMSGEYWKFTCDERKKCYKIAVEEAGGVIPVLAGVSHSGTEPAIELAQYAQKIGADGIVVQPPYYNDDKTSTCLYEHYREIANRVDLPIMIQDTEGVGPYLCPEFYRKLVQDFTNIVAVKTEGIRALERIEMTHKLMGDEIAIIGGMAAKDFIEELNLGADGNVPDACLTDVLVEIYNYYIKGNVKQAERVFDKEYKDWLDYLHLHRLSNYEVEKETLKQRGIIKSSHTRLPRGPSLTAEDKSQLGQILKNLDLN